MAELEKKPVKIVETILRDAHQSQIATRMTTEPVSYTHLDVYKRQAIIISPFVFCCKGFY